MIDQSTTFTYDFSLSYYENFLANRYNALSTNGSASVLFNDEGDNSRRIWYDTAWGGAETEIVNGIVVDNGINVKEYINNVYSGDQPTCLVDKIAREIGNALGDVFGDVGCDIGQIIYDIIDSITDVFGSFICTATLEDTRCGESMLKQFKEYRDTEVLTTHQGMRMVRYYEVLGPKIVRAIDEDSDKEVIYKIILADYLVPLQVAIESKDRDGVFGIYFKLMDDMVKRYGIRVGSVFDKMVKENV